jgi:heme-degrading monooxygenase HmoA
MHALFFEVRPFAGHLPHYFEHVARLKPVLARHTGLAFLDRYASLSDADLLLSHQLWNSEDDIVKWRNDPVHRTSQTAGRHVHFADYRIRVGERVWHHEPGTGDAPDAALSPSDAAHVVALYGGTPIVLRGFAAFESVNTPGRFIALTSGSGSDATAPLLEAALATADLTQAAVYRVRRDYGQHDRAEAPGDLPVR